MEDSPTYSLHTLVVATAFLSLGVAEGTEIVMPPRSVNATLNSTAIFSCQITGEFTSLFWRINNTLTPSSSPFIGGLGMTALEVFCSEDRDMSEVECIGSLPNRTLVFSDPALLRVQGLLTEVTILSVLSTTTSITLTWVPPFSLDITGVEPDFTHTVEVYNITSGGRQEVGVYENITDSIFKFTLCEVESQTNCSNGDGMNHTNGSHCTLVNSDPSNLFEFIVTAVNAVGRGKPSEVNATFLQEPTTTTDVTSTYTSINITTPSPMAPTTVNPTGSSSPPPMTGTKGLDCTAVTVVVSLATLILGGILGVVITLLIVSIGVRVRQHSAQQTTDVVPADSGEIEMKRCDAYDVARKRKQVKIKPPVYEEVV